MYELGQQTFWAGQKCQRSGRYTVHHYQHRLAHSVVVFEGDEFPPCLTCGERVHYSLEGEIRTLNDDPDFRRATARKKAA